MQIKMTLMYHYPPIKLAKVSRDDKNPVRLNCEETCYLMAA